VIEYIKGEAAKLKSSAAQVDFFAGISLQVRIDSFEILLFVKDQMKQIVRNQIILPNW
jgi:hypothetical protein